MGLFDLERVHPKVEVDEVNDELIKDMQARIIHLEDILSEHTTQWNAPTLIKGLDSTHKKIQSDKGTFSYSGGNMVYYFTLPVAYTTDHNAFICSLSPTGPWDYAFNIVGSGALDLTTGFVMMTGVTAQTYNFNWISVGK